MITRMTLGATVVGLTLVLTTALISGATFRATGPGGNLDEEARWRGHLVALEEAVDRTDIPAEDRAWREARAAALASRRWEMLVQTADVHLRLAQVKGVSGAPRARELYLAALFRARDAGSRDGALRVAGGFEALGDHDAAGQARRVAEQLPPAR